MSANVFLFCCVLTGAANEEPHSQTLRFDATVPALERLREWLQTERVTHVAMESTGSYWIPIFNVLEDHVAIILANPEEVKNRKGHKTDRNDAKHIADLLRHEHIRSSYIPPKAIRQLRDLTRRRVQLTQDATRERKSSAKAFGAGERQDRNVLTDVFGVSGQEMILALREGNFTPAEIAGLARGQAQRKIPQRIEALEGHRMTDHCALLIRSCLRHLGCLQDEIETLDDEILLRMKTAPFESAFALLQTV